MRYISTRGEAAPAGFGEVLIAGLAGDGGLFVPEAYPRLDPEAIRALAGVGYAQTASRIVAPYLGEAIERAILADMIADAYAAFDHPAVAPLTQIDDNLFVLELFHGPTLAFKDLAMQMLGRMMNHALRKNGERATVVGATSGDTGASAIEAFRGLDQVDVFIFYPHRRVSDVQRRQMTCVDAPNVHVVAVEGTFDDCQAIVKALFNHRALRQRLKLSGVNSINFARVMLQAVYYFTSAVALGAPDRRVSYSVPTGNFGDVLAGWMAKKMGLPIERLVIATNENDILTRALASGVYAVDAVRATQSPSMDIQISSNFERLLFEACAREGAVVRGLMSALAQSGRFDIPPDALTAIRADFDALRTSEAETTAEIGATWRKSGYLLDPHTAVASHAGRRALAGARAVPMVVLGTAHPGKFPDAAQAGAGVRPQLPQRLADLMQREERFTVVANDQAAIERFIKARTRA